MRKQETILKELFNLRTELEWTKDALTEMYAQQDSLYIEGHDAGIRAADMARAMHPDGETKDLAETVRQKLRAAGRNPRRPGELA